MVYVYNETEKNLLNATCGNLRLVLLGSRIQGIQEEINNLNQNKISISEKGSAGGVAELDSNGFVPSTQLPSFVDDVLEFNSLANFPSTGESGKIYIAIDTEKTYRWSGTGYVVISDTITLGETSSTAYRGDKGKEAYDNANLALQGLTGKANTNHNHNDLYNTKAEITTALSGKSNTGHNHDDRYYDKTYIDNLDLGGGVDISGKLDISVHNALNSHNINLINGLQTELNKKHTDLVINYVHTGPVLPTMGSLSTNSFSRQPIVGEFFKMVVKLSNNDNFILGICQVTATTLSITTFNYKSFQYMSFEIENVNNLQSALDGMYNKSEVDAMFQEVWDYINPYLFYDDCTGNNPSEKYEIQSGLTATYTTFEDEPVLSIDGPTGRSLRPIVDRTQNDVKITWSQYMTSTSTVGNHYFGLIFNNTKNASPPSAYPWYLAGMPGGSGACGIRKDNTGSYPFISGTFTCPKQEWLTFELTIIGDNFTLKRLETGETVTATDSSLKGLNLEFFNGQFPVYMKNIKIEEI